MDEQRELDLIQNWLADTTEEFDDWDYDGKELIIFLKNLPIERYTAENIKEFLKGF